MWEIKCLKVEITTGNPIVGEVEKVNKVLLIFFLKGYNILIVFSSGVEG